MIPKAQNLQSSDLSLRRRSHHWKFGKRELDLSIDKQKIWIQFDNNSDSLKAIPVVNNYEWLDSWLERTDEQANLISWFDSLDAFKNFIIQEHKEIEGTPPEQFELQSL